MRNPNHSPIFGPEDSPVNPGYYPSIPAGNEYTRCLSLSPTQKDFMSMHRFRGNLEVNIHSLYWWYWDGAWFTSHRAALAGERVTNQNRIWFGLIKKEG